MAARRYRATITLIHLTICIAFVKLETSQLPMSWLKTLVFQNIHAIVVTLLTSQLPIFWLKALKLDTTAGESAIQNNVGWSIANYTDATARQYLIDTYRNIPIANVLVKSFGIPKHPYHRRHD
jgi:hypothetical protein